MGCALLGNNDPASQAPHRCVRPRSGPPQRRGRQPTPRPQGRGWSSASGVATAALFADSTCHRPLTVDCGPSLDYLTYNALAASARATIVTQSQTAAILGLARLLETLRFVAQGDADEPALNPDLTVAGVLVNLHEEGTISGAEAITELRSVEDLPLIEPFIPKAVVIRDAMAAGLGLDQWPTRQARRHAETYDNALTEILR